MVLSVCYNGKRYTNGSLECRVGHVKEWIYQHIGIPKEMQVLKFNGTYPGDAYQIDCHQPIFVDVQLGLQGGKGGFGSLLRGGQPGAKKKKTSNHDACRDLNGRRIRHVKQEQELVKWAEEQKKKKEEQQLQQKSKTDKLPTFQLDSFVEETATVSDMVTSAVEEALSSTVEIPLIASKRRLTNSEEPPAKRMRGDMFEFVNDNSDEEETQKTTSSEVIEVENEENEKCHSLQSEVKEVESKVEESKKQEKIDLHAFENVEELQKLGMDFLKQELQKRGLKCGGTLTQRAERLYSVKGIPKKQWPHKILQPKKQ